MDEQRENGETDQGQHSGTPWYLVYAHPLSSVCKERLIDFEVSRAPSGRENLQLPCRRVARPTAMCTVFADVLRLYTDYNSRPGESDNL